MPYDAEVAARQIEYVTPECPKEAARLQVRGIVMLPAVIDARDQVRQTRVIRSIRMLDDAASLAVCSWRFTPARMRGAAIPVAMTVTVESPLTHQDLSGIGSEVERVKAATQLNLPGVGQTLSGYNPAFQ